MRFYSGIDLGARESQLCVIDDELSIQVEKKVRNELPRIVSILQPFKANLQVVVESTFNWYWLIDGLQAAGYDVCLAHTLGLHMITGAKVKTDKRDALGLAKLLKAGMIPKAYIYPKESRPVRDLLRRRSRLVALRAEEYVSLRGLLLRYGILEHSRNGIKRTVDGDLERWFQHPVLRLHGEQQLRRTELYSAQINQLEKMILGTVKDRPEFQRLQTVAGIGKILAITIFYETWDIRRFASARDFSSYCRLVPGVAQSGNSSRRGRGSKQGNPYLKWAFSQAAQYAVRNYPPVRRCFERHLRRHRGRATKLIAYEIVAHKLAQAVYYVLRDGTEYQEEMLFAA